MHLVTHKLLLIASRWLHVFICDSNFTWWTPPRRSEDSNHVSKFHQLKHDPAVSRRRLAPLLQHNYPGNYVNSEFFLCCLFVRNQFCHANVEEEVSPFKISGRDKPGSI